MFHLDGAEECTLTWYSPEFGSLAALRIHVRSYAIYDVVIQSAGKV